MSDRIKNITMSILFALVILFLGIKLLFSPQQEYSLSERGRVLEKRPPLTSETVLSGEFMKTFENFGLDQFPWRDSFRELKMFTALKVFKNFTVNDLYIWKSSIAEEKREYNEDVMLENLETLTSDYNKFIKNKKTSGVYFSIIPDKNHYFAKESGRFSYDWEELEALVKNNTSWASYVDIEDTLSTDSFYRTDSHWSQDKIVGTAKKLAEQMGVELPDNYTVHKADKPFNGVYADYILLPVKSDEIVYLRNDVIDSFIVKSVDEYAAKDAKKPEDFFVNDVVYNSDKLESKDMYDFFLSGAVGDITIIENPNATTDKNLVVFRDSFGSSLAPLLAQAYEKTYVIDRRGVAQMMLANPMFVNFQNADVLFIYSPVLLDTARPFK